MIALVVAVDQDGVIGKDGKLPWYFPEDLKYFKSITQGHSVLMGRKTYESILAQLGRPLPKRHHVVLSTTLVDARVEVISDLTAYLGRVQGDLYVIGGASVYAQTLPFADRLYITHIDQSFQGDTYFPDWDPQQFELTQKSESGPLTFAVYERISHD